jgi:arginase
MARDLVVIGAPTSAGSYAPGQEQAPRVLRENGLVERLSATGRRVRDAGDGPLQVWSPDRAAPRSQNVGPAALAIRTVAAQVGAALDDDADVLVVGGNCTIAIGVMSALTQRFPDTGLLYVDRHYDINTPATSTDGALDWMGIAHGLGLPGTVPELTADLGVLPVLSVDRLSYLGVDPAQATAGERHSVAHLGLAWEPVEELVSDPAAATRRALARLGGGTVAVHVDLDVLDFTDAPLSESTGGRNSGPTLDALTDALRVACADARFRVLSIGELNPARSAGEPKTIDRFIAALETAMG